MKIKKIKIVNYRLLKDLELDLEDALSVVVGKNNTGKTSLLSVMQKFLSNGDASDRFSFDDLNAEQQKALKAMVESSDASEVPFIGFSLKLFIEYKEDDDLSNISLLFMDLSIDNKTIVLGYEYSIFPDKFEKLRSDFRIYKLKEEKKITELYKLENGDSSEIQKQNAELIKEKTEAVFYSFLKKEHKKYFSKHIKTYLFNKEKSQEDETMFRDITNENLPLNKLINFKVINAKREVSNRESDKTLSTLSSKYYDKVESSEKNSEAIDAFKDTLSITDHNLDKAYEVLFTDVIAKISKFGGLKDGESALKVVSTLQHKELLKGNTTVMYDHSSEYSLPEHYNGLGYMNLIGMIFEIEVILKDFRRDGVENEKPADINFVFIEEPEAHTHPQMQYIFIKNIKDILEQGSKGVFNIQTAITTHSSHIAASSDFNDIKYFLRDSVNTVISKNLKDLEGEYGTESSNFKFLKKYLTLNRSELFFADKVIFIEGDTERVLIPAMMKKIDQEYPENPLLSQNISIVEVGNYSHIFDNFIRFVGVKSLIITDIDSFKKVGEEIETCLPDEENAETKNHSLKYFHNGKEECSYYLSLTSDKKAVSLIENGDKTFIWEASEEGKLFVAYQIKESEQPYAGRSFEDAFFSINKSILSDSDSNFESLTKKWKDQYVAGEINAKKFAENAVNSKPSLAIEILLNSKKSEDGKEFSNWHIPTYIEEGLLWLKEN